MINSIGLLYMYIFVLAGVIAFFWRLINKVNKKDKKDYIYTPDINLDKNSKDDYDNKTKEDKQKYYAELSKDNDIQFNYKKIEILTQTEYKFYNQLRVNLEHVFHGSVNINFKVRLADLLTPETKKNWKSCFNKIQSKHIDFVITDKITAKVILLIELDDHYHEKKDRISRDKFVDEICRSVGYKINHTQVSKYYNFTTINESIRNGGWKNTFEIISKLIELRDGDMLMT